jgi:hypothetical protein
MSILLLRYELNLHTRLRTQIANEICWEAPIYGAQLADAKLEQQYPDAVHRPGGPCNAYNCHGLTFGSRRTRIWDPAQVERILIDDGYIDVTELRVLPGDAAVYYGENGDIEHSGIVVEITPLGVPKILGKWGYGHETVHLEAIR